MKAIIITDAEARSLLDQLKLAKLGDRGVFIDEDATHGQIVDATHRHFHYVVCRWLQEMGADTVRST